MKSLNNTSSIFKSSEEAIRRSFGNFTVYGKTLINVARYKEEITASSKIKIGDIVNFAHGLVYTCFVNLKSDNEYTPKTNLEILTIESNDNIFKDGIKETIITENHRYKFTFTVPYKSSITDLEIYLNAGFTCSEIVVIEGNHLDNYYGYFESLSVADNNLLSIKSMGKNLISENDVMSSYVVDDISGLNCIQNNIIGLPTNIAMYLSWDDLGNSKYNKISFITCPVYIQGRTHKECLEFALNNDGRIFDVENEGIVYLNEYDRYICITNGSGRDPDSIIEKRNIQLEIGNKKTEFENYKEYLAEYKLKAPLRSIGNIQEVADVGLGKVKRVIDLFTVNGSEIAFDIEDIASNETILFSPAVDYTKLKKLKDKMYVEMFCEQLPTIHYNNIDTDREMACSLFNGYIYSFYFRINKKKLPGYSHELSRFEKVQLIRNYLMGNNITFYSEVNETVEKINPEYVLLFNDGIVSIDSDWMEVDSTHTVSLTLEDQVEANTDEIAMLNKKLNNVVSEVNESIENADSVYSIQLSQDVIAIPTNSSGVPDSNFDYNVEVNMFIGGNKLDIDKFEIMDIASANNIEVSISSNIITFSVRRNNPITSTEGVFEINCRIKNKIFTKGITYTLSRQGEEGNQGDGATYLVLHGDQVFKYSDNYNSEPEEEELYLTAEKFNLNSNIYKWSYRRPQDIDYIEYITGDIPSISVRHNDPFFFENDGKVCSIRCEVEGQYDEKTMFRVSDGAVGSAAKYVIVSGEQIFIYDSNDNPHKEEIVITADQYGYRNPQYQWAYKDSDVFVDINGETNSEITITHDSQFFNGNYCVICCNVNEAGEQVSSSDELSIVKLYDGKKGESSKTIRIFGEQSFKYSEGIISPETITISAKTDNMNDPSIQWFYKRPSDDDFKIIQGATGHSMTLNPDNYTFWVEDYCTFKVVADNIYTDEHTIVKIYDGEDGHVGSDAYTVVLTNESHTVVCDSSGSPVLGEVGSGSKASSTIIAYKGSQQLQAVPEGRPVGVGEFSYSFVLPIVNGDAGRLNNETFYINEINADSIMIPVDITVEGIQVIRKEMTVSKAKAGKDGDVDGVEFVTVHGAQVFKYAEGATTPDPLNIQITSITNGIYSPTFKWYVRRPDSQYIEIPSANGSSYIVLPELVINGQDMWQKNVCTFKVVVDDNSNITDEITVYKVFDGKKGDKGDSSYTVLLTNENHTIRCDEDGNAYPSEVGQLSQATSEIIVYRGAKKLQPVQSNPSTDQFSFNIGGISGGDADKLNNYSLYVKSITEDSMSVEVNINAEGIQNVSKIMSLVKSYASIDGEDSYSVILSNEAHTVACRPNGDPLAGELGVNGKAKSSIFAFSGTSSLIPINRSSTPKSGEYNYTISCVGGTADYDTLDRFYLSSMTADNAIITVRINLEGIKTIEKTMTITKSKQGEQGLPGDDAYTVVLTNESHTVPANNNGVVDTSYLGSSSQAYTDAMVFRGAVPLTVISETLTPGTGQYTMKILSTDGGTSGKTGNGRVYLNTFSNNNKTAVITISINAENSVEVVKTMTITKSITGENGVPGTPGTPGAEGITVVLSNEAHIIQCAYDGTYSPTEVGAGSNASSSVVVYRGGTALTAVDQSATPSASQFKYSIGAVSNGTAGRTNNSTFHLASISGETAIIPITVNVEGKQNISKSMTITKTRAGQDGIKSKSARIIASQDYFKTTDNGKTWSSQNITLTPVFGEVTFSRWQYSLTGQSGSWINVVNGEHGFSLSGQVLTLNVNSDLFTKTQTLIIFRVNTSDSSIYDLRTIGKVYDSSAIIVGGRNTFKKTTNITNLVGTSTINKVSDDAVNGFTVLPSASASSVRISNVITENGTWTVSGYVKSSTASSFTIDCCDVSPDIDSATVSTSTSYVYFYRTFNITNNSVVYNFVDINNLSSGITYFFKDFKVEKSNTPSTWSPAPEDTWSRFESNERDIKDTKDEVGTKLTKTVYETDQTGLNQKLSTMTTAINQNATDISFKANSSTVNTALDGINTTLSNHSAAIKVNSDSITNKVWSTDITNATGPIDTRLKAAELAIRPESIIATVSGSYTTKEEFKDGLDGTIASLAVEYALSTSNTVSPSTGWSTTAPANPGNQYMWSRVKTTKKDGTVSYSNTTCIQGADGKDGNAGSPGTPSTNVVCGTESFVVPATSSSLVASAIEINIPFAGYIGANRAASNVNVPATLPSGMTVKSNSASTTTADGLLVLSIAKDASLGIGSTPADSGFINLTFTCNGISFGKMLSWSKSTKGLDGSNGTPGTPTTNIVCGNESQTIPCTSGGLVNGATTITIPFAGYIGTSRAASTVSATGLPTGITIGSNTGSTTSANGSLVLNVANEANLGGASVMSGNITLTFTCNSQTFTKLFSWAKSTAGPQGSTGAPGAAGTPGTSSTNVVCGSESVSIPCTNAGATSAASEIIVPFAGYIGANRATATVSVSGLPTGITVKTNTASSSTLDGSLVFSVASGSTLGGILYGEITLTFSCNSLSFVKKFSWSKSLAGAGGAQGPTGPQGTSSTSIVCGNESQAFPCTSGGLVNGATTITIPFAGYIGTTRAAATVAYSTLPSGITLGSNTAATTSANGSLVFNVANNANLGGASVLTGTITLTFSCNSLTFTKIFSWSKSINGENGNPSKIASIVASRDYFASTDGGTTWNPSSIDLTPQIQNATFSNWQYSTNGTTWTTITGSMTGIGFTLANNILTVASSSSIYTSTINTIVFRLNTNDAAVYNFKSISKYYAADGDLYKTVVDHNSSIAQLADSITSKVEESKYTTDINGINGKISTNTTAISQLSDSISSKVSQVEFDNSKVAASLATGKMLLTDPTFTVDNNNITKYDNNNSSNATVSRVAKQSDSPSASGFELRYMNTGSGQSPNLGGFIFNYGNTRANAVFVVRFIAKLPVGYSFNWHQNSSGTGGTGYWLTKTSGTGKYDEYMYYLKCGNTGTFSSAGHVSITGTAGTSASPMYCYMSYGTVYDLTNSSSLEHRMNSAEQKITSDAIINTVTSSNKTITPMASSFRYIRDWLKGSTSNDGKHWVEVLVYDNTGAPISIGKPVTTGAGHSIANISRITDGNTHYEQYANGSSPSGEWQYAQVDLGSVYNDLKKIQIIHYYLDSRRYNHILQVSSDGTNWTTMFNSDIQGTYTETVNGKVYDLRGSIDLTDKDIVGTSTILTKDGFTVKNGSLTIENNAGEKVLYGDVNGNLQLSGTIKSEKNDMYVALNHGGINFRDSIYQEHVLRMATANFVDQRVYNGVVFGIPTNGDFLDFSYIHKENLEDGWSGSDKQDVFMSIAVHDFSMLPSSGRKKGVNFFENAYFNRDVIFPRGATFTSGGKESFVYAHNEALFLGSVNNSLVLRDDALELSVGSFSCSDGIVSYTRGDNRLTFYTQWGTILSTFEGALLYLRPCGVNTETAQVTIDRWGMKCNNQIDLGSSSQRWGQIYSTSGYISTSDSKLKENINKVSRGPKLRNDMSPSSYDLYNYVKDTGIYHFNYKEDAKWAKRTRLGILANEVPDNVFNYIGIMSKTDEEYKEQVEIYNKVKDVEIPAITEDNQSDTVVGTDIPIFKASDIKSQGIPEEPMRMIDQNAQIAMLQEVLSIALAKIETLENKVAELEKKS